MEWKNGTTDESSENTNGNSWILINKIIHQAKDTEGVHLPEMQEDLTNGKQVDPNTQISNNGVEIIHEYLDSDNTSNDVSVITESDIDNPYQNSFTIPQDNKIVCEDEDMINRINRHYDLQIDITKSDLNVSNKNFLSDDNMYRSKDMVDRIILQNQLKYNAKIQVLNMIICVLLGSIVGTFFGVFLTTDDMNLYRNGIKDLQTECHSIINTFKKLNSTLNEVKAHIIENKFNKDHAWHLLESINYSNEKNNKSTKESFDNDPYILNDLHTSLNVLSLLSNTIYDNNSLLKSETNKTLDIVNNTKMLYEALVSFNSSTQNMNVPATLQFLQNAINKIHHTSHSLLADLVKKISNIMSNVHYKYNKMKDKLNEKLCHLKNVLPEDSEFLKQLTMRVQSLSNYHKYCHSKNTSKLSSKTKREQNIKTNGIKKKTDDLMSYTKFEKRDTQTSDTETYCNELINDYSQSTKITGQCIDETLNDRLDETISKHNTKVTSDYGTITADETKENRPKPNNYFKSNSSAKKVSDTDKPIEKKNVSPQKKTRNHVPKSNKGHYKPSFKKEPTEQNHYQTKSADWLFERSNEREKQRQALNMYFSKVLKTSKSEDEIDASIRDMMRRFGQSIDKIMHLFEHKINKILGKHFLEKVV